MIAHLAFLALVSSVAAPQVTPASASVSTLGKSRAALHAELLSASQSVCKAEFQSPLDAQDMEQCVASTYESALWRAQHVQQSNRAVFRSAQLVR